MRNYFNTPSSFGCNTDSSLSGDLVSARSRISDINALHSISRHDDQSLDQNHAPPNICNSMQECQEEEEEVYRLEDIYLGLTNIKKNKSMTTVFIIFEQRMLRVRDYAMQKIKLASLCKLIEMKKQHIKCMVMMVSLIQKKQRETAATALFKLFSNMKYQKIRQLRICEIFGSQMKKRMHGSMATIFQIWKLQNTYSCESNIHQSLQMKQVSCKMIKVIFSKQLSKLFSFIKYCAKLTTKRQNGKLVSSFSSHQMNYININKSGKLVLPGTYSMPYSSQFMKMPKIQTRTVGYKAAKGATSILAVKFLIAIELLFRKPLFFSFQFLKRSLQSYIKQSGKQVNNGEDEDKDDAGIIGNILKHSCWLISRVISKNNGKTNNEGRSRRIKLLMLKMKRKQIQNIRKAIEKWQKEVIFERLWIMRRVKQLQEDKQTFIESFK